jgi:hypothetical protein
MVTTRRQFMIYIAAAAAAKTLAYGSDIALPSCCFAAPLSVLARAGARIDPTTNFAGQKQLPTIRSKSYSEGLTDDFSTPAIPLALGKEYLWTTRALSVAFLGNVDPQFQKKVVTMVNEWTPYSGITITLVPQVPADIRVEFVADGQNWSQYGTDAQKAASDQATVHFGSITDFSADDEIYRVAVHEFGHALGALHEHQSPAASGIDWDTTVVDAYYHGLNWTDALIKANVYATFPPSAAYCTRLDPLSIMIYDFPPTFTTNQMSVKPNWGLSDLDKSGMKTLYDQARSDKI